MKVLVTLGDSWPEGAELGSGRRYGEILQQELAFDQFYNYGSGGASNEDMLEQLQRHIKQHWKPDQETTAIFFLTNPARTHHFPRHQQWMTDPSWTRYDQQTFKDIVVHFHREEHQLLRTSATITALQSWCASHNIKDFYFAGWVRYPKWLPGVDTNKIWAQGNETVADWFGASKHNGEHLLEVGDNQYIRPNFCHPNQEGHNLIAAKLASWISR